ncbi:deoxyguanosinetriphosphate triphosphohydrolase [Serpentinicella alkaliphila]|uniref:dGTPase n=1 Tax=Serpentinicella alkaliphila TaxID=1734049 RepID=A0A4R2TYA0_9FIRM|nr:deoxyguanosinetriphosphate triphosphohydrolase [Serpentinicella alkaliphila]QUH26840.1 deoxyguanosinetriphosphate triphosphohydrolase [Serpentinicella alkaliphila]TCQ08067.1 dGTPase [Serpentinicella alkaliphila]
MYRKETETFEKYNLSPFAQLSEESKGRQVVEEECDIRTCYQKDRDRIIHSESFRKLKGKTQVYIIKYDSFRTRLTHTLEVSQIARTIARALKLNEDLVEAIALGHDLGHTCFGHSGEEVLNRLTGHFKHNEQSLRVIDVLEREGKGLNLTMEVRDGILNHTGEGIPFTLEGKLVKLIDRVTYLCHDIQDSISAGILRKDDIPRDILEVLGDTHSLRVNTFVHDIIKETKKQLEKEEDIIITQSHVVYEKMSKLREFMFKNVYNGELCTVEKEKATYIVEFLYKYFINYPNLLPELYLKSVNGENLNRVVTDFIAMCTDSYAIKLFQNKVIPFPENINSKM